MASPQLWEIVRRVARNPLALLTCLVPAIVIGSVVPDLAATASGRNLSFVGAMFLLESQFRKRLNARTLDIEFSRREAIQPILDPNRQVLYRRT